MIRDKTFAKPWVWIPFLSFIVLLIHSLLLGMTDDEAYYWVLSKTPALGYAYHPPAVAWCIAISNLLISFFTLPFHGVIDPQILNRLSVRLASCFMGSVVLSLSLYWIYMTGVPKERIHRGAWVIFSVIGFYGASWMMVPDIPLFLGWILCFVSTYYFCFNYEENKKRNVTFLLFLFFGSFLSVFSKYSGVLIVFSSWVSVFLFCWLHDRRSVAIRVFSLSLGGMILAMVPILIWNAQNGWGSILYQIQERHHGGELSFKRYLKFWGSQLGIAGPALVAYSFLCFKRMRRGENSFISKYIAIWALPPAAVYCTQPLMSDFKPHWALVVWFPFALELAYEAARGTALRFYRVQVGVGIPMLLLLLVACHFPVQSWLTLRFTGKQPDPKWDVMNDMYGWPSLVEYLKKFNDESLFHLPVIGSRYQTASQAAFVWPFPENVSRVPRTEKEFNEWPKLLAVSAQGPQWPALLAPVLYISDNRYQEGPKFLDSKCAVLGRLEASRYGMPAKWIDVWKCEPVHSE